MFRTLPQTREANITQRLLVIAIFTVFTIVAAKISVPFYPVPFTMQPFAVLLAALVLGARDGFASQALYVALIAIGLPFDARGVGTAALFGPTGGYLLGFAAAAFVVGALAQRFGQTVWQRWLVGIVGVFVIYAFGVLHLSLYTGRDLVAAWNAGAAPFLALDIVKALLAAGLIETLRWRGKR